MPTSSRSPLRYGSAGYSDRPSQFWLVAPRSDGPTVMSVLVPTAWPLMYIVAVLPDRVMVTWDQVFSGSVLVVLICCSPPAPLSVMANRGVPLPSLRVRNM